MGILLEINTIKAVAINETGFDDRMVIELIVNIFLKSNFNFKLQWKDGDYKFVTLKIIMVIE